VKYVVTAELIDGQVERIKNNLVQRSSRRAEQERSNEEKELITQSL
jgi:hypothetical protein